MQAPTPLCPECGAPWPEGHTCQDDFYQMLAWEIENPSLWEVHHLTVLCYHLQHPSLYSPAGLAGAQQLLVEFVEHQVAPQEMRGRIRSIVDSSRRTWKIKGTPGAQGAYRRPIAWPITAAQVVAGGADSYVANVRAWAASVLAALRASGNLGTDQV